MLVEEFARKHDLCPAGEEMMRPFLHKTVREWWEDAALANRGTWVYWLASRAQLDSKTLVRTLCQCARHVLDALPDPEPARQTLAVVEGWCDGRNSRDDARAAGKQALAAANKVKGQPASFTLWSGIHDVARCVYSTIHAPGTVGALAQAWEMSGQGTADEAEAQFAAILRRSFTWADLECALDEKRPSPLPRPATLDEVQGTTAERLAAYGTALADAQAACSRLEDYCRNQGISLAGVSRALTQPATADVVRELVATTVQKMAAADARPTETRGGDKSKPAKRSRMMV
jgi:hypothetical protein